MSPRYIHKNLSPFPKFDFQSFLHNQYVDDDDVSKSINCPQLIFGSVLGISVPHSDACRLVPTEVIEAAVDGRCDGDFDTVTALSYQRSCGVGDDDRSGVFMALLEAVELGVVLLEEEDDMEEA